MIITDGLVQRDGVWRPATDDDSAVTGYRKVWEDEAAVDPVRSATARTGGQERSLDSLTPKMGQLWTMATTGLQFESILEIGPGYGRVPLYLSHRRGMTCQHYIGVDISLNMLRELRRVATEYGLFGGAELSLACQSADSLPLPDDSIDFAMASAVFLHMGKDHVKRTMAEVARVLRPGGQVAFDTCFPNRDGSANRIEVWRTRLGLVRSAHHLKYWSRDELELALTASGLREKCPALTVRSFSLQRWPKAIWRFRVPYARALNAKVQHPAESQRDRYSVQYCAYDVSWADSLGPEAN